MTSLTMDGDTGGARTGRPWTEAEDMELLTKGPVYGYGAVAERMGRTFWAGYHRHRKLTKGEQ